MIGKKTVTIGIPAHNEEANISYLLYDLLSQEATAFTLENIIVICDGCTDRTEHEALSVQSDKVRIVTFVTRQGIAAAQNEIFKRSKSDICVLFDADIRIPNPKTLKNLLLPILHGRADFTSGSMVEITPLTSLERALWVSMRLKETLFSAWNRGDNIYTVNGKIRAFSKQLYTSLHFPYSLGEDAYSYLFTVKNGFNYRYAPQAEVLYKLPDTISDHVGQSMRFQESKQRYITAFGSQFIKKQYAIPFYLYITAFIKTIFRYPLYLSYYLFLKLVLRISKQSVNQDLELWSMATSSKKVQIHA